MLKAFYKKKPIPKVSLSLNVLRAHKRILYYPNAKIITFLKTSAFINKKRSKKRCTRVDCECIF